MSPLERNTHRSILDRAHHRGAYVVPQTSPPADAGTPDHLWCYRGRFLGVELKPGGARDLDPIQRARAIEILRAGGIYAVLTCAADVDRLLDQVDDEIAQLNRALAITTAPRRIIAPHPTPTETQ